MTKEQKEAIERCNQLIKVENENWIGISNQKAIETVLNLIQEQQVELEKKDKIIYEIAKSNVKLKGYDVEETYINNTISFYSKYIENLERNPHWRKES